MQGVWEYLIFVAAVFSTAVGVIGVTRSVLIGWQSRGVTTKPEHKGVEGLRHQLGKWVWRLLPWRWRQSVQRWLGVEQHSMITLVLGGMLGKTLVVMLVVAGVSAGYGAQGVTVYAMLIAGVLSLLWPWWVRYQAHQRRLQLQRCHYPFFLDMLALSVESGAGVMLALQTATESLPEGDLQRQLQQALFRMQSGMSREQSLARLELDSGLTEISSLSVSLDNAIRMGLSLSSVLRTQADQYRQERFLRAEKKALEASVKMLFPVVSCILPCTFLVLAFPLLMHITQGLFE